MPEETPDLFEIMRTTRSMRRLKPDPVPAELIGLGATLTTLYLSFEKEVEAALGLPPDVHSYALLPIGYPMGRFGPVRRISLAEVIYEDRWGQPLSEGGH